MCVRLAECLFRHPRGVINGRFTGIGYKRHNRLVLFSSANKIFFCTSGNKSTIASNFSKASKIIFLSSLFLCTAAYSASLAVAHRDSLKSYQWDYDKLIAPLRREKNSTKSSKYTRTKFIFALLFAKINLFSFSNILIDLGFLDQAFDVLTNKRFLFLK